MRRYETIATATNINMAKGEGEVKTQTENMIKLFISEFIGTGLLLFFGCVGCVVDAVSIPISHHIPALTFGLAVMISIQCFGHLSGAHLNPVVTFAAVILGNLKPLLGLIYAIAQFAGATLGFGILKLLIPYEYMTTEVFSVEQNVTVRRIGVCSTVPNVKLSSMQALGIETIITGVLILVCCAVWDKRNASKSDSIPLRFGFVIAGIGMTTAPFTGASMNPARSLAPAILNGDWAGHWIYWVGPVLGTAIVTYFYKFVYGVPEDEGKADEEELHHLNEVNDKNNGK